MIIIGATNIQIGVNVKLSDQVKQIIDFEYSFGENEYLIRYKLDKIKKVIPIIISNESACYIVFDLILPKDIDWDIIESSRTSENTIVRFKKEDEYCYLNVNVYTKQYEIVDRNVDLELLQDDSNTTYGNFRYQAPLKDLLYSKKLYSRYTGWFLDGYESEAEAYAEWMLVYNRRNFKLTILHKKRDYVTYSICEE